MQYVYDENGKEYRVFSPVYLSWLVGTVTQLLRRKRSSSSEQATAHNNCVSLEPSVDLAERLEEVLPGELAVPFS